jgi:O-antigen/teichoic acid export membrane protein
VGGKLIAVVRILVLARLLVPDDFGLMAIALVTVQTSSRITDLGMVPALVHHQDTTKRDLDTAWTIGLIRAALLCTALIVAAPWISELFAEPRATGIIRSLAFLPVLHALGSIRVAELIRRLEFGRLAILSLTILVTEAVVAISLAAPLGVGALVAGAITGPIVGVPLSYLLAPYRPAFRSVSQESARLMDFGKWIFLSSLIATAGSLAVQLTISRKLGSSSLGIYYLAVRLTDIPVEFSGKVIGEVAFPVFAKLQGDSQRAARAFRSLFKGMAAFLVPIAILLMVFGPRFASDILGPRWEDTGPVLQILALGGLVGLLGDACAPAFKGLGYPKIVTWMTLAQLVVLLLTVNGLTERYGVVGAAAAWLPATLAAQIIALGTLRWILPTSLRGLNRSFGLTLTVPILAAIFSAPLVEILARPYGIFLAVALFAAVVTLLYWLLDRRLSLGLLDDALSLFPQLRRVSRRFLGKQLENKIEVEP